jgi:lysine-specific demethylase/histidyl-hydroxylase NO66
MTAPDASPGRPSALARCTSVDVQTFAAEHWSRRPLLSRSQELPAPFDDLLQVTDVEELVADRALRTPFFRTVSEGGGLPVPVRTVTAGARRIGDLVDGDRLAQQHAEGATLVLQSVHRMHPPVARFCRQLATELGHATQCNAYITPGGEHQGFDFHHDTHDVFVLQVSGRKRWVVHEPVVRLPLPSQPQSGAHLVADGAEPLLDVELEAGDALYLPRGYVHAALTTDEHSVHLTVGVLSTTWYDVVTDLVSLAGREEEFRDALPVSPADGLAEHLPGLLRRVADFVENVPLPQVEQLVRQRLARAVPVEPLPLLAQAAASRSLAADTPLRPRRGLAVAVRVEGEQVIAAFAGKTLRLPAFTELALRRLLAAPATPADCALGGLDDAGALVLARRLLREGAVVPA